MNETKFSRGIEVRKEVLGDEYVENSLKNINDFNRPLQELLTEYCWNDIWGRENLPKKTRSMLNLAMLTALNRPHELEIHLHGAINNGVTKEEIREVLLHTAVYCGFPAAIDSFRTAQNFFNKSNRDNE